ncbi:MAG: DNA polymerase III subunit gamma/tau, partial [Rhizobiales bacterium]|nr:DNA polymerase III subunit gamma/tau [Hyphomicrobiales bacterium]
QHAPRPAEATSAVPAAMPAAIPATVPVARPAPTPPPATQPARILATLEDVAALAGEKRDLLLKTAIERDLRFVRIEDGRLDIALEPGASKTLITDLARKLSLWTGRVWVVAISSEPGEPTLRSMAEQRRADVARGVQDHPLVQAVMDRFPGAEITRITPRDGTRAAAAFESGGTADLPDAPPWSDDDMDDEA